MEFELNIADLLKIDEDGFICITGKDYAKAFRNNLKDKPLKMLSDILDRLGQRSASAQKLKQIITNNIKFYGTDQRMYIKVKDNKALGFVKVGERKLFFHDYTGAIKELYPTAVLDIYVHQSCQRTGVGKQVFQKFLAKQSKTPDKLAYDRPSQKLLSFLRKYYKLASFIPQNNNYVIFDKFFQKEKQKLKPCESSIKGNVNKVNIFFSVDKDKKKVQNDNAVMKTFNFQAKQGKFQPRESFKTTKDQTKSSFGCPWAVQEKLGFRTSSNAYGSHYRR